MRLLLLLFIPLFSFAQADSTSFVWSKEESLDRRGEHVDIKGTIGENSYAIIHDVNNLESVRLASFGADMQLKELVDLTLPSTVKGEPVYRGSELVSDGILVFSTAINESTRDLMVYATKFDLQGKATQDPKVVQNIRSNLRGKTGDIQIAISPSRQVLLLGHKLPKERDSNKGFQLTAFDANLNLVWENELRMPLNESYFRITEFAIDNEAQAWMLSGEKVRKVRSRQLVKNERQQYLLSYNGFENKLKQLDITLRDKWIHSIGMVHLADGNIGVAGFYSSDFYFTIGGVFGVFVDTESKAVISQNFHPFSRGFFNQFPERSRLDRDLELEEFYFDRLVATPSGGLCLMAEEFFVDEIINAEIGTGRQTITYVYHYGDVLAVVIDREANLAWENRLPKMQVTQSTGGTTTSPAFYGGGFGIDIPVSQSTNPAPSRSGFQGYVPLMRDDGVDMFFLDNPKNAEVKVGKATSLTTWRKAELYQLSLRANGEHSRQLLSSGLDGKLQVRTDNFLETENGLLLLAQSGKNYQLGRLQVENEIP